MAAQSELEKRSLFQWLPGRGLRCFSGIRTLLVVVTACGWYLVPAKAELRAGVAVADITPPVGQYQVLASRKIGVGARDPLHAKAVVLETPETKIAIVSLDLVGAFPPEVFEACRRRLKSETGIQDVILNASHTHSSPDVESNDKELAKWPWITAAIEETCSAIVEAHRKAVPVRLRIGYGASTIGTNRRWITRDGVKTLGRNEPNKRVVDPSDRRVGVLRIERTDGSPLAVVVHYACHPVTLMSNDTQLFSADYVGEMEREVASRLSASPEVLFWQGAAGDINMRDTIIGSGEPEVKQYGRELASAVLQGWTQAQTDVGDSLSFRTEIIDFGSRWSPSAAEVIRRQTGNIYTWFGLNYRPSYPAPIGAILIGKELALAVLPGEPFIDFQFQLDASSPVANTWLLGYCDRVVGYLPTIRAAAEGGYGGNGPETLLEVGAGERMVNFALTRIYDQLGRFGPLPPGVPRKKKTIEPK